MTYKTNIFKNLPANCRYFRQHEADEAVEAFKKAIGLDCDVERVRYNRMLLTLKTPTGFKLFKVTLFCGADDCWEVGGFDSPIGIMDVLPRP